MFQLFLVSTLKWRLITFVGACFGAWSKALLEAHIDTGHGVAITWLGWVSG